MKCSQRMFGVFVLAGVSLIIPYIVHSQDVAKENRTRVVRIDVTGTDSQNLPRSASGSGFFIHSDGYLLTALHVVGKETDWKVVSGIIDRKITLMWSDQLGALKSEERVVVVYYDTLIDLALLRLPQLGMTPVRLGDSRKVLDNEKVMAIGYPQTAKQPTPAEGKIQLAFDSNAPVVYGGFLKFSAAIDRGYSGGPLFNEEGAVIGVVNAGLPYSVGVGFAIPINLASGLIARINRPPKFDP